MFINSYPLNNKIVPKTICYTLKRQNLLHSSAIDGVKAGISTISTSEIFSHHHDPKIMMIQFLIGTYTYGLDRYRDKKENIAFNYLLYDFLYIANIGLLSQDSSTIPFIALLYLTKYYKFYKKELDIFKPAFVAMMWTFLCVTLPHTLQDNNTHQCLQSLGCYLTVFGISIFKDIFDMEEDKKDKIVTVPLKYTQTIASGVATFSIISSIFCILFDIYLYNVN